MKKNLNEQIQKILEVAEQKGLSDNFFFTATFNDYKRQRVIIAKLAKELDESVVLENGRPNPCLQQYNKAIESAARLATSLIEIVYGATGVHVENVVEEKKECPDFEHMAAKDIKKWCKHYELDPDDYSRQFLFKALKKRWNFEYGD